MKHYSLKVKPCSIAEDRLMVALHDASNFRKEGACVCRLGCLFGKSYNEYIVREDLFEEILDIL